jgi:predicted Fe-Mo cluster-binding NifX family protein
MKKRFVFVKEVEKLVAQGKTGMQVPEGTRLSPLAADLIREKGIQVSFSSGPTSESEKETDSREEAVRIERPEVMTKGADAEERKSLIAVASDGKVGMGDVGSVAARSHYFLIFDDQENLIEVLENPHRETGGGAGPLVANLMAERGVSTLVAQNFGINIKASLDEKDVSYFEFSGQVGDAVKSVLNLR